MKKNEFYFPKFGIIPMIVDKKERTKGCGGLFKSGSGIIICGEERVDGNRFLCKWCLNELKKKKKKNDI